MFVRRSGVLAALIAVLFVAGCAGSQAGSSPAAPGTSAPSASASAPAAAVETLSGTVEAGVEPGCLVLKGSGKDHLLLFGEPSLKAQAKVGSAITVVGKAEPTQLTTCQQGIPFIVASIHAN
jgi:hypothetical protein